MSEFGIDVSKAVRNIEDQVEGLVRAIALELFGSVILDSPVKTGRLRGNWRISMGSPKGDTVKILDPTGEITLRKVEDVVFGADITRSDVQFFLTNNLPYVGFIEFDGISKQAPEGMIRRNAIRVGQNLKQRYG